MSRYTSRFGDRGFGADDTALTQLTRSHHAMDLLAAIARHGQSRRLARHLLPAAVATLGPVGQLALGNEGTSQTSLAVVRYGATRLATGPVVTADEMARPPTWLVRPVAWDTSPEHRARIHDQAFPISAATVSFGMFPDSRVGTPAEAYDVRGGPPEAVIVPDLGRHRHKLLETSRVGRPDLRKLIPALLDDDLHGRLISYVLFPLLGPMSWANRQIKWPLIGHVLITNDAPASRSASLCHLSSQARTRLGLLLGTLAEIVAIAFPVPRGQTVAR